MSRSYTKEQLQLAIDAVQQGMSYRRASELHNVPLATVYHHKSGKRSLDKGQGRQRSIPQEIEDMIVESVLKSAAAGFPLTKGQVLEKVGRLCQRLKLKTQFVNNMPKDKYWRCLKKRYTQLTIRSPECCDDRRLTALTPDKVNSYFDDLHALIAEHHLTGDQIWNMDETGLQFAHRPAKVVACKGSRVLHSRTSVSKESVTILACVSADGRAMPPACIVRGKTDKSVESFASYLGPSGAFWTYQERGWMDNTLGVEWFKEVFLAHCGSQRPQLLLLDSHSSHEVVELLDMARRENIHIVALPPHTTQALQPLDKVVFKPFKSRYHASCTTFMSENPRKVVDKESFPLMLKLAWEVMEEDLIKKSFSATGVYPPDRHAVDGDIVMSSTIPPPSQPAEPENEHPMPVGPVAADLEAVEPVAVVEPVATDPNIQTLDTISLAMNLSGISEEMDVDEAALLPDVDVAALLPEFQMTSHLSDAVSDFFSPPPPPPPTATSSRAITGHRLLTSDEIYRKKVEKMEKRLREAEEKEKRKQTREFNRQQKAAIRARGRGRGRRC